jgi:hypothetical protein
MDSALNARKSRFSMVAGDTSASVES